MLAGCLRRGVVDAIGAQRIAEEAELMLLHRADDVPVARITELIVQSDCTAYDLEFLAVTMARNVPLVTEDRQLLQAFPERAVSMRRFVAGK